MLRKLRGLAGGLFFVSILWSTAGNATTIELKPIRAVNVDEKTLEVIQLFINENAAHYGTVVSDGAPAEESLEVLVVGMGETFHSPYLVHFSRKKGDGQVVQSQLTLSQLEEAPTVLARLTDSVFKNLPLDDTRDRNNVALVETQGQKPRVGQQHVLGVKLSMGAPFGSSASYNGIGAIGFDGRFERDKYFVELGAGFVIPGPGSHKGYGGVGAELGMSYFVTNGDTAVYLGGGILPRLIFSEASNSPLNIAPYLQAGVAFDRSMRMRLYADLRLAQNLLPVRFNDATNGGTTDTYPTEVSVQVGIGW